MITFYQFLIYLLKKNYEPNLFVILFSEAGMVAFVFACIVLHFPSKPKHPPSITSTMERTAFLPSVLSICTNPQVGIYYSHLTIILYVAIIISSF